ncbi:hypothetical protein V495_00066 [Pseudogymnoascus sp. VKM F-4514 (FW-929)]|nr:hypothetical protein V495_00066 [Pseudogymnoascus sp. VKM F-4514 (FW-929)]KFY67932.1 hypothetical protein V497_00122 [Pseudogymnoascus sp. VKM F-4516 (FW-969)]
MQVSQLNEASLLDFSPTFEDSGYDTCTTHIDDDDSIDQAGLWAAEQLTVFDAEALPPSTDEGPETVDAEASLPITTEQPEVVDIERPLPPTAEPLNNSMAEAPIQPGASGFDDAAETNDDEHEAFLKRLSSRRWPLSICTMPRLNSKNGMSKLHSRPSLRLPSAGPNATRFSGSLRSPDRFLASVDYQDSSVQKFRINKDPQLLSPSEKLVRDDSVSLDAFSPRRNFTTPNPPVAAMNRGNTAPVRPGEPSTLMFRRDSTASNGERQISLGSVWAVGGLAPLSVGVSDGRGGLTGSGTNAPLYTTSFSSAVSKEEEDREKHEGRLAKALDLDRAQRIHDFIDHSISPPRADPQRRGHSEIGTKTTWKGTEWVTSGSQAILDAPNLRDDFYCSVLAYSHTSHTLAVGLGSLLYAWSEMQGVHLLNSGNNNNGTWLTSIAFSSTQGCKCILAYGRSDGTLNLMSLYDRALPRFEVQQPCPIACLTWRPTVTLRPSRSPHTPGQLVKTEDLVVGDEVGNVYYYSVEWPDAWEVDRNGWTGVMTLLARISVHTQQICGLAWSHDGSLLATGGNDNLCCLFEAYKLSIPQEGDQETEEVVTGLDNAQRTVSILGNSRIKSVLIGAEKHRWVHGAAVKAIAFCPWRDGLIATGGGSNDKCIHFFHAVSGACLATISVAAQVTSLIWSTTRREICATFGYAQPEHPYRIAVFSWPECKQVAAIPWEGEHRALYAIPYPGGPNDTRNASDGGSSLTRTAQEGCIVVAASDESVKFHEVWSAGQKATAGGEGLLGGSDILEGLEGIDKEGDVIR